ncbi:MAG TPA: hypothetical protein VFW40_06310, partial [Capsulimonadaceae bacterium]|nr:hypothetical protein [Capsulimonadaceae bacterium]
LSQATGLESYLEDARANAETIRTTLQDQVAGGFWDRPVDPNGLGALAQPRKDFLEDADTVLALLRLATITEEASTREAAQRALLFFEPDYRKYSYMGAAYGRAIQAFLGPTAHVVIVGDLDDDRLVELRRTSWQVFAPHAVLETRSSSRAGAYPPGVDGAPRAYVCVGTSCHVADSPEDLLKLLASAVKVAASPR